ncbi:MAG: ABC transporter permease [Candidatus Helarchaeota archaeon]
MMREYKPKGFLEKYFEIEAILGIVKRDVTKYFRNKQQILSSLLMPTIFMIFLRPGFANLGGAMEFGVYMGAGIICMVLIMSGIMMSGMPVIFDKMIGFQDIYAVAPVKRRNIVFGFIFGGAIRSTFQATIIIIIGVLSGLINPELGVFPNDFGWFEAGNAVFGVLAMIFSVIMMYIVIFISASIYACIGLSIAARTDMTNAFLWFNLINMPLVFISGAIIPVEQTYFIGLYNPTTFFADAMRVFLGGVIGDYGTGNFLIKIFGLAIEPNSAQALFLGFGFDLIIMFSFGIFLFYLAFKIFGSSLTESSSGYSAIFHKKVGAAQKKMLKNLEPEEREFMEKIMGKINLFDLMMMGQEDPSKLMQLFTEAGLSTDDVNKFMRIGAKLMVAMSKKKKKKKKKSKNK